MYSGSGPASAEEICRLAVARRTRLMRLVRRRLGSVEAAEEVYAELLASLAEGRSRPADEDAESWLVRRIGALATGHARRARRRRELLGGLVSLDAPAAEQAVVEESVPSPGPSIEEAAAARDLWRCVRQAMARLSEDDRNLLVSTARLGPGRSAAALNLQRSAARRRLRRVRARLWSMLPADVRDELAPLLRGRGEPRAAL